MDYGNNLKPTINKNPKHLGMSPNSFMKFFTQMLSDYDDSDSLLEPDFNQVLEVLGNKGYFSGNKYNYIPNDQNSFDAEERILGKTPQIDDKRLNEIRQLLNYTPKNKR
jgi:hypothetical protein